MWGKWINFKAAMNTFFILLVNVLTIYGDFTKHPNFHLLDLEDCGFSVGKRILGGDDAELGEYPWMALLALEEGNNSKVYPVCGGVVINNRYIVTAAHCILEKPMSLMVILGEHDLDEDEDCVGGRCAPPPSRLRVEEALGHPSYHPDIESSPADIALIRTNTEIVFHDFIKPICLDIYEARPRNYRNIDMAEIVGWGSNSKYGRLRTKGILQRLTVGVLPRIACAWKIKRSQLCVASAPGKDTCNGDSGGPLMTTFLHPKLLGSRYFLIGVLSYGLDICALFNPPMAVYTDVSTYLEWILDNIRP